MSCNKNKPCCKKESCELPRAEINTESARFLLKALLDSLRSVISNVELAEIARLVLEIMHERKLPPPSGPQITTAAGELVLQFGPQNQYKLHLPVASSAQRTRLAEQFSEIARELYAPPPRPMPSQLPLPFSE